MSVSGPGTAPHTRLSPHLNIKNCVVAGAMSVNRVNELIQSWPLIGDMVPRPASGWLSAVLYGLWE